MAAVKMNSALIIERDHILLRILVLTKRQYMNKDLINDWFGRFREIPLALAQKGHKVHGLCLSYAYRNEKWCKDGPVRWESVNATAMKLPGLIQFIIKAQKYAGRSDIIWACSDSIYGIIGLMLSKKCRIPLVFDLYDNFEFFLLARLPGIKQLYRYTLKKCAGVTCVSQPLAGLVASYGRKNPTVVLENAIREDLFMPMNKRECRHFFNLPQNAKLIGTAGDLAASRGIKVLFNAFGILKNKYENLHLVLAGPRNIKIPDDSRIHYLGVLPLDKVPLMLNTLNVGVICNQVNNFGRYCFPQKTREIMACDIPLVATRIGSLKKLLEDHPDWLYAPGDSGSLAKVIEKRLIDPSTGYKRPPTWLDLTDRLEDVMLKLYKVNAT
jgi:teichuronic acid biosynthesis glycosyltransferase TuaC